jgi:hypothetical protein
MLQNRSEDFLHEVRAILGLKRFGNVVEVRDGVEVVHVVCLKDLCGCHDVCCLVFTGLEVWFAVWKLGLCVLRGDSNGGLVQTLTSPVNRTKRHE